MNTNNDEGLLLRKFVNDRVVWDSALESHLLSKSSFLRGTQCIKSLYLHRYNQDLMDKQSVQQRKLFETGRKIEELAHGLFPGGINANRQNNPLGSESILLTRRLIDEGTKVIYEAAFFFDKMVTAIDILVRTKNGWHAFEVKSSKEVADTHIIDASFQYYILLNSGINITDFSILYINKNYIRKKKIDLHSFFIANSIIDKVKINQLQIIEEASRYKSILEDSKVPKIRISENCFIPYPCDFKGHCWKNIPEISVFNITGLKKKEKFSLYQKGIITLDKLPDDFQLNEKQKIQVECHKTKKNHIDKKQIKVFLDTLKYPLHFLDFETVQPAIPLYKKTRPYQQIPFQFSLHMKEKTDSDLKHIEFLAETGKDPRKDFVEYLLNSISSEGSIIVYNKAFEETRLKELSEAFPRYAVEIDKLLIRIVDLMIPFKQMYYYIPGMMGSYSIKKVLPSLIPEMNYNNLQISNGEEAMSSFEEMQNLTDETKIRMIRRNLLEYCKMDTLAMVKILEKLEDIVNK